MTALNLFPSLPGLGWPVTRSPGWRTRIQRTVSGREMRLMDQTVPLRTWSVVLNFLRDGGDTSGGAGLGTGYTEEQQLEGFFLQQGGAFLPFLINDPNDNSVANQQFGTANGSTTQFQLCRTRGGMLAGGGFTEPVYAPNVVSAVYVNGVLQSPSGYTVAPASLNSGGALAAGSGMLTFGAAPSSGPVTGSLTYWWPVRFNDDSIDLDEFLYQVHQLKKLVFRQVLP